MSDVLAMHVLVSPQLRATSRREGEVGHGLPAAFAFASVPRMYNQSGRPKKAAKPIARSVLYHGPWYVVRPRLDRPVKGSTTSGN